MRLLYYSPATLGGIADYARLQVAALIEAGVDVTFLGPGDNPECSVSPGEHLLRDESRPIIGRSRLVRQIRRSALICANIRCLKRHILLNRFERVLFASYCEYAAPLWSHQLRVLTASGIRFAAILHDPVRNYVVGPQWWHNRSVRSGYSFLSEVFVHEAIADEQMDLPNHVAVSVVPHGPSKFSEPLESRNEIRLRLGIPAEAKVALSFGQIRNGKNLDLVIRAMRKFDDIWLLVAGKEAGGVHRPLAYYQRLAAECGIADRCRWISGYIAPDHVGGLFLASDVVLLTYGREFRSASGVLNAAVQFNRPCIVSSGEGPLLTQVNRYCLGVSVEPDNENAIRRGLHDWLTGLKEPLTAEYLRENSWRQNAELVRDRLFNRS